MGRLRKDKGKKAEVTAPESNVLDFGEQAVDPGLQDDLKQLLGSLQKEPSTSDKKPREERKPTKTSSEPKKINKEYKPAKITPGNSGELDIPPTREWWTLATPLPAGSTPSETQISSLMDKAQKLLPADAPETKESEFMSQMISSGTLSDKLSALTLMVQSSPMHQRKALEKLKEMASKKGKEESLKALRCIVDWWVSSGCPNRKLRYFRDQPSLLHSEASDLHLAVWYFEDYVKKYFFSVLQILESLIHDNLPYVRTQSYELIFTFLRERPEQEQNLLRLGVSGLADNTKPIPSKVTEKVIELLQLHPGMKTVVINEICEKILKIAAAPTAAVSNKHIRFSPPPESSQPKPKPKPAASTAPVALPKGALPALQTLSQLVLSSSSDAERAVARKLIKVYFDMFNLIIPSSASSAEEDQREDGEGAEVKKDSRGRILEKKKKQKKPAEKDPLTESEENNSKILSTILTGVNRAIPFAFSDDKSEWNELLPLTSPLFHLSSSPHVNFNVSLQAMMLLERVVEALSVSKDLDAKSPAANLKKRYFRTLHHLLLDVDSRLGNSGKEVMFLNLVGRAFRGLAKSALATSVSKVPFASRFKKGKAKKGKAPAPAEVVEDEAPEQEAPTVQEDLERLLALLHRFVQLLISGSKSGNPEFVEGGLVLLDQLCTNFPKLRTMTIPASGKPKQDSKEDGDEQQQYDPYKREPEFARASKTFLWELTPLLLHYHPTISLHASQLLSGHPLSGASTDMGLNTVAHFLDRFVFKNPKKLKSTDGESDLKRKGASHMQPGTSALDDHPGREGVRLRRVKGEQSAVLGRKWDGIGEEYLAKWEEGRRKRGLGVGHNEADDEADEAEDNELVGGADGDVGDEVQEDEDEEEIWNAIKASMPGEDISDISEDDEADMDGYDDLEGEDDGEDALDAALLDKAPSDDEDDDEALEQADEDEDEEDREDGEDDELASASDASDLLPLDGLLEYPSDSEEEGEAEEEEEEWGGISSEGKKRKRTDEGDKQQNRKKKKRSLPTFASYEDYAKMIEDGPEDFI